MELNDPYGFTVKGSDDDMQSDHDLVHEPCGTVVTRIEVDDNMGTLVSLMNEHVRPLPKDDEPGVGSVER